MDLIILFTFLAWAIFILAMIKEDRFIGFISGCFILVIGIFTLIYGVGITNNDLTRAFGYIHLGIGLVICLASGIEFLESLGLDTSLATTIIGDDD